MFIDELADVEQAGSVRPSSRCLARRLILGWVFFTPAVMAQPRGSAASSAIVSGAVYDSIALRPLRDATVQLMLQSAVAASPQTVRSDSLGRFRFVDVLPGRYLVEFRHPALDALGIEAEPATVAVPKRGARRVDLAIPSVATLRAALCDDDAVRDSVALIIGYARRELDRSPLDSVIITVASRPRARAAEAAPSPRQQQRVGAASTGWFVVCSAQRGDTIQLSARRNTVVTSEVTLTIPAAGVLLYDVLVRDVTPAPAVTRALDPAAPPGTSVAQAVSGVVTAADGGQPIPGAIVGISGGPVTRTDAMGAWRLTGVSRGAQTLTVRALRYAPISTTISVTNQLLPVRLALTRLQNVLDTVNVFDHAAPDRNLADFLGRQRTRGSGTFLTEADITSRQATLTSDLFLAMQGGMTIVRDAVGNRFLTMRSNTLMTRRDSVSADRCLPAIFLDGLSMRKLSTQELDGLVRPGDLIGIEVYRAANAPVEFSEQDGCGTILMWTKRQ